MTSYRLADVELSEISLVDVGANQHAKIAIWKRATRKDRYAEMSDAMRARMKKLMSEGMSEEDAYKACMTKAAKGDTAVTPEELTKNVEALQAQVTDLTKRADDAEAAKAALEKAADAAGFDVKDGVLTKRADTEFVELGGEKIAKSAVPAAVLKALETQAADIAKMKVEARNVELAKRGEAELPNLAGTPLAKGRLLDLIGDDKDVLKALKAADIVLGKAAKEIGSLSVDEGSADYRLTKMATDYAVAKGVPFEAAYAEVTKSGAGFALLREIRAEAN